MWPRGRKTIGFINQHKCRNNMAEYVYVCVCVHCALLHYLGHVSGLLPQAVLKTQFIRVTLPRLQLTFTVLSAPASSLPRLAPKPSVLSLHAPHTLMHAHTHPSGLERECKLSLTCQSGSRKQSSERHSSVCVVITGCIMLSGLFLITKITSHTLTNTPLSHKGSLS